MERTIANNVVAERNRSNLSQDDVANVLGKRRETYMKYEKDASKISATELLILAQLFKCNIQDFYLNTSFENRESIKK